MRAQKPELVTAPAAELLSLEEVKEFLRVENSDEDTLLGSLIATAAGHLDGFRGMLGKALLTQTWRQRLSDFPEGPWLAIPVGPVRSITNLEYIDQSGGTQTFTAFHLINTPLGSALELETSATWPLPACRPDAVTVTWSAGFGDTASSVPEVIRTAALQLVAHFYAHREAAANSHLADIPFGVAHVVSNYRDLGG